MNNVYYQESSKVISELLLKYWLDKPEFAKVDIYTWPDSDAGLRVSEVSLSNINPTTGLGGGASFMQSDVDGGGAVFAVERAIIELQHFSDEEDLLDAKWRAIKHVHGDEAAKAFADAEYPSINPIG